MKEWSPEEPRNWEEKMRKLAEEEEWRKKNHLPVPAKVRSKKALKASFALKRGMDRTRERIREHNQAFVSSMRYEIAHAAWFLGNIFRLGVFLLLTAIGIGYFFMVVSKDFTLDKTIFFLPHWIVQILGSLHFSAWLERALTPVVGVILLASAIISPFLFIAPFLIVPAVIYRFLFPRENTRLVHFFPEYWIMKAAVGDAVEDIIREKLQRRQR